MISIEEDKNLYKQFDSLCSSKDIAETRQYQKNVVN